MLYVFELDGHRIHADFPMGTSPKTYRGHRRVITPPAIHFHGDGFTKACADEK